MKKSRIYLIVPLVAIVIFYLYYRNFASHYDEHVAEVAAQEKATRNAKLEAEAKMRQAAVNQAIEEQKVRKQQRLDREAKDRKQKDDRENARLLAEKADQEQQKLSRQVEKLEKDVSTAKEEIGKIEADNKRNVEEVAFLKTYVTMARDNQKKLSEVLAKIDAADIAMAKAAAAAAAAAKK
jgi:E3 ubiquitin-protein ligase DOA10